MEELKKKNKHDHKPTKWLKFSIFALVMLAPFFSVLAKVIYVQSNDNAKDSYYGQTINEVEKIQGYKNITTYYQITMGDIHIETDNLQLNVSNVKVNGNAPTQITENREYINLLYFYKQDTNYICRISFKNNTSNYYWYYDTANYRPTVIEFYLTSVPTNNVYSSLIYYNEYNDYSYLDNVFTYAVNQLSEDNLYNWAKNVSIYTPIYNMVNGLGMNDTIAMLLSYWAICTAVYIVFDIIIEIFTKLTHLINE